MISQGDDDTWKVSLQEPLLEKMNGGKEDTPTSSSSQPCFAHQRILMGLLIGLSTLATAIVSQATVYKILRQAVPAVTPTTLYWLCTVLAAVEICILHVQLCYLHCRPDKTDAVAIGAVAGVALGWFLVRTFCVVDNNAALDLSCCFSLIVICMHHYGRCITGEDDEEEDEDRDDETTRASSSITRSVPVLVV